MSNIKHCKNDILLQIDPTDHFSNVHEDAILNACGILVPWAILGDKSMEENLVDSYQFFMGWRSDPELTIDGTGKYMYEGDPDLYPMVSLFKGTETVHIYRNSIVAVRADDTQPFKSTRMD